MSPLALLVNILSSTGFKVISFIVFALILALVYMEFRKGYMDIKLKKQQLKINDRTLAGTL